MWWVEPFSPWRVEPLPSVITTSDNTWTVTPTCTAQELLDLLAAGVISRAEARRMLRVIGLQLDEDTHGP